MITYNTFADVLHMHNPSLLKCCVWHVDCFHVLLPNTPGNVICVPDDDFGFPMDSHDPRPASAHHDPRPSSPSRPSSSSRPSSPSRPFHGSRPSSDPSPPGRPPFQLTSFDDLPSGAAGGERGLDVTNRLSRLDYFFKSLHLQQEDCRRRLLCEVVRDPHTFAPLSDMISDETRQVLRLAQPCHDVHLGMHQGVKTLTKSGVGVSQWFCTRHPPQSLHTRRI